MQEINALVDGFVEHKDVLEGKLSNKQTYKEKIDLYERITKSVNSQSLTQRSMEEVKKKLSDLKTGIRQQERKRLREARATGGDPAIPDLKDWQEKLLSALTKVSIEGFSGIDNFKDCPGSSKDDNASKAIMVPYIEKESEAESSESSKCAKRKTPVDEKGGTPDKDEEQILAVEKKETRDNASAVTSTGRHPR
ncbi:uncharacterized protein LOC127843772 [Dreissena polymorpha]|uniref:Myb/SANT-like DNA-binding domain-containing protein n=1 Tax=Dreissena polymorpha TaxID=45954 RepID=A0A9D4E0G7_DREPO|nr:uncharacterized protein LOC127843772 [Dreissena polymorpha]KAH3770858.1 hypothetical protein DPMN_172155 [Dreissena polymorpha]